MHHHYRDIRDRLGEPAWWDEAAVPRYCGFHPEETNYIYADQVAFLEIACQRCGRRFKVAMSWSRFRARFDGPWALDEQIKDKYIRYGDPPNAGCCQAGPTMNSVPLRVIEFWEKDEKGEWHRDHKLEIEL